MDPLKAEMWQSKENEKLGNSCVSPPVYFPKRKQTPKIGSGSTGIGWYSEIFQMQILIQFLLDG